MITIVDYGLGNLSAVANVYRRLSADFQISSDPTQISRSSKLILPGVGAFDHSMMQLKKSGLSPALEDAVLQRKVPILGICVGMQMLVNSSDEGSMSGLGWITGKVKKFDSTVVPLLPHMGWNNIEVLDNRLFHGCEKNPSFYFLHSYYVECAEVSHVIANASYIMKFACAINKDNIYGVQFHPEKSHRNGIQLLKSFAKL